MQVRENFYLEPSSRIPEDQLEEIYFEGADPADLREPKEDLRGVLPIDRIGYDPTDDLTARIDATRANGHEIFSPSWGNKRINHPNDAADGQAHSTAVAAYEHALVIHGGDQFLALEVYAEAYFRALRNSISIPTLRKIFSELLHERLRGSEFLETSNGWGTSFDYTRHPSKRQLLVNRQLDRKRKIQERWSSALRRDIEN